MRVSAWSAMLCLAVLSARRPAMAQSPTDEVDALRQEATAARTKSDAYLKLDQAEASLKKLQKSMDSLDYAFVQNEIAQARGLVCIAFWQRDRSDISLRDEGRRWLLIALDKYDWLGKQSEDRAEAVEGKFHESKLARNKLYKTIVGNISRANYKKAWTQYLLGMSSDRSDERQKRLKNGLDGFVSFTARGYRNDPIIADCFIGQARCLYELERYFEVTTVLDPDKITQSNTTPEIFRRVTSLRIKAYQVLSRHLMVDDCANLYFESLPDDHSFDSVELEIAVAWARSLALLISDPAFAKYEETYEKRLEKIQKLISPHGEPWRTMLARVLSDSGMESPLGFVERARQYFIERQYEQAVEEAKRGLGAVAAGTGDEEISAELRYVQFAAYWNQSRWLEAYRAAASFLRDHPEDRRAGDICNKAVESGIQALKSEPPLEVEQFLKFLEYAEKNFPDAAQVKKAPWYKAHLLLREDRYAAAIGVLEAIRPDSPVYRQAQLDLARGFFKQAEAARKAEEGSARELARLYLQAAAALGRYGDRTSAALPESELAHARSAVDIAAATADRLLRLDSPEPNSVLALIDRIQPLRDTIGKSEGRLLAAAAEANLLAGNTDIADKLIDELLNADSSEPHRVTVLINIANRLEQTHAGIGDLDKDAKSIDRKLARIYVALLNLIGRSEDKTISDKESVVRLNLAKRLRKLHRFEEAIDHYTWYLRNTPMEKAYDAIRDIAIIYEQIGQYELALHQWSRLYGGMKRRTNEWIEAAYHIIWCHIKAGDRDRASRVLVHFRALCPQSELGEWGKKFGDIEKELSTVEVGTVP